MPLSGNARPHFTRILQEKILDLDQFVLPHLPHLAPTDFHLFHSQKNTFNDKKFSQEYQIKTFLENFLNSKPAEFYTKGSNKIPGK